MKNVILLAAVALVSVCGIGTANAQSPPPTTRTKGFLLDMWALYSYGDRFQSMELMLAPGLAFNRTFFGRAQIGAETSLWNVGGTRTWSENLTVGPAVGANVWRSKRTDDRLAVVGAFGHALFREDTWAYNSYDLGLELSDRHVLVGAGVRYYDTREKNVYIPYPSSGSPNLDRTMFYVKIGWTLGK